MFLFDIMISVFILSYCLAFIVDDKEKNVIIQGNMFPYCAYDSQPFDLIVVLAMHLWQWISQFDLTSRVQQTSALHEF